MASRYSTVDSFENWNPNIQSLADRLLIGPQRTLLERVQGLNNRYGLNVNVTRTYRWSPGYMDQIKEFMVHRYLETHMKRKISTFFNQIDNKSWMLGGFSRTLREIETILAEKRRTRAVFQDNSDIIEDRWQILHNIIVRETNKVRNTMEHISFDCDIIATQYGQHTISFTWAFPEMDMNIFVGNQYYFPVEMGKVEVNITFDIDQIVTQLCNDFSVEFVTLGDDENCGIRFNNLSNSNGYGRIAAWYDPKYTGGNSTLQHPFISSYQNDLRTIDGNGFTSTCLGDLTGRLWSELSKMDLLAVTLTLQQWLTTFNARDTRPLNNIRQAFWGLPERLDKDTFVNVYPMNPDNCNYPEREYEHYEDREDAIAHGYDNDYCDTINCGLREACHYYKFIEGIDDSRVGSTAVEDEDFEVVDRDADNIHGGEYAQTHTAGRDDQQAFTEEDLPFDTEAVVEEVNRINRENGLTDDGEREVETAANYREEMDRINNQNLINGADPMSVPLPEDPLTEEQMLEQLLRQQYRVIDLGRE